MPISPGDVLVGKYRVDRIIGHGGMGFVIEAWHLGFEERVAVKLLRADVAENEEAQVRFEREARAAFKIKNEHIARVIDVGRLPSGAPFMVMEYLEGIDLGEVLADRRLLPIDEAVDYTLQACEAIGEAHAHGIIHRDLKPENLFLAERADGSRTIKVLDFGLSKVLPKLPAAPRERALTDTKQVMGTAEYMSPEQWMSARDVGPSTDIWSIGIILYELICGQTPFEREQLAQMCQAILGSEPPPMRTFRADAPEELQLAISKCMAKNPADRYATISELARALIPFAPAHAQAAARRLASQPPPAGPRSKPPSAVPAGAGLAPASVPLPSAPSGLDGSVGGRPSIPGATGVSAEPAAASAPERRSGPGGPAWPRPARTWAEILQDRPRKSGSGWLFTAVAVIAASAAVAALAWMNRNAFEPEPASTVEPSATIATGAPSVQDTANASTTASNPRSAPPNASGAGAPRRAPRTAPAH